MGSRATARRALWTAWERVTKPSPAVVDPSAQRTARLLSAVLLCIAPLGLLSFVLQSVGAGGPPGGSWAMAVALGAIVVAYVLSRSRYFRIAGALTTLTPTVGGLLVVAGDADDPGWFAFMALCPALAALLLPLRWALVVSAVNLAGVAVAVILVTEVDRNTAVVAVMFNAIMGAVLLTAAGFRDRLERARRADLLARQRLQQSILEGTFGGIAVVRSGVVREANQAFADLFHRHHDELRGTRIADLFDVESFAALVGATEFHEGRTVELSARRWDRSTFDAEIILRRTGAGQDDARVVAIRDISERKQAEQVLVRAQRMESVGRLAAGFAHDTNNELFVIAAHADELLHQWGGSQQPTEAVQQIHDAAHRMSTLIRRLLLLARDETGEPSLIELGGFLHSCRRTWQQVLGGGIELRIAESSTDPSVDDGLVRIDRTLLEQLLLNLVLNARDAMGDGGVIHVAAGRTIVPDRGDDAPLPGGTYQRITVSDTGGGITAEDLPHIFEAFFTTKEPGLGTGLGLYTSREIVRASGGTITVDADEVGSTFTVLLPEVAPEPDVLAGGRSGVGRLPAA